MLSMQRLRTRWLRLAIVVFTAGLVFPACAMVPKRWGHPVSVTEVVELSRHGVAPQKIVDKMRRGGTVYVLSEQQLTALRNAGVTPVVITYMRDSYEEAVEAHPQLRDDEDLSCFYLGSDGFWYGGGPWGFHPDC